MELLLKTGASIDAVTEVGELQPSFSPSVTAHAQQGWVTAAPQLLLPCGLGELQLRTCCVGGIHSLFPAG